jgi:hypothetical protein
MHIDVAFLRRLHPIGLSLSVVRARILEMLINFNISKTETRVVAEIFIWLTTLWGDSVKGLENPSMTSRDGSTTAIKVGCYFHTPCSIVTL